MRREVDNRNKDCEFHGDYVGRDLNVTNIIMFRDSEREFVVTHNAEIKPVSYFTGRETELKDLRQRIEEGRKSVLVSGMGGIGKTHICRKLFEEYLNSHAEGGHEPFRYIGYIEYAGDMSGSLMNCLKYRQQDSPEQNQEAAWRELEYLAADGKLLLFVDNVNVPIREDAGLGRLKQIPGAVVLTSRRTFFSKEFEPYRIGFLSTEQCIVIYEKIRYGDSAIKLPEGEIEDLEYVIEEMAAGHTITIEFLAHLAATKCWDVKRLRSELESKGFRLEYKDEEDKLINIQEEYEKLYDLSVLTEAEQNILEAFSVFPYIPLEAEICNQWLLEDARVSKDDDVLIGLYRKGWLQFDLEQKSYSMHPVFAQFIYEKNKPSEAMHSGLIESCQRSLEIPASGSTLECQRYIPFAENIIKKIDMKSSIQETRFMAELAYLLQYIEEYKKAEELYEKNLRTWERVLGEEHPDTAVNYNNLAYVYERQGEYKQAEELYKKVLDINEKVLGKKHSDTATSYNNLAYIYQCQKDDGKAQKLYEKSLQISKRVLGENHPQTALLYNNLAYMYARQGKYEKAEELYKKCIRIRERFLGENHPETAMCYNNLEYMYLSQGEYIKSKKMHELSLQFSERLLSVGNVDIVASYNNLAAVYEHYEKHEMALDYYLKAYKIIVFKFGLNHLTTKIVSENMEIPYKKWKPNRNFDQWLEEKMKELDDSS